MNTFDVGVEHVLQIVWQCWLAPPTDLTIPLRLMIQFNKNQLRKLLKIGKG